MQKIIGELRLHPDGYGFVVTDKLGVEDVFVPARYIGDALHGDFVEVAVVGDKRGKGLEGRIYRVVERRVKELVGRLEYVGKKYRVISDDRRVRHQIMVKAKDLNGAKHGQYVVVKITAYPRGENPMHGFILRVLGKRGSTATEVETIIVKHHLPIDFPEDVMEKEEGYYERMKEGLKSKERRDLKHIPFVTIDGETAKDFDDAVAVEKIDEGNMRLWVAIADVSWFVGPGSPIDTEAYLRGTSVYFPGMCLPMIPEFLSTELCSLNPNTEKLVLVAEMDVDESGDIIRSDFCRAIISSRKRLTYKEVAAAIEKKDEGARKRMGELLGSVENLYECHNRFRKNRINRGSIDFDLPEPEIILDVMGGVESIGKSDRDESQMVIEDLMIAANEAVAEKLAPRCIFRAHPPPPKKKLAELQVFLQHLGYNFKMSAEVTPKRLAQVVQTIKGKPEEKLVNNAVLRSMSQAVYSPENLGHFGLASKCYCHFTSPIRRYPDLMVHRLLVSTIEGKRIKWKLKEMESTSEHCSRRERVAMEAERDVIKLYSSKFMEEKVGEVFDGVISHLGKFGIIVQLADAYIEGLVPIDELPGRFKFNPEKFALTGRKGWEKKKQKEKVSYRIGDKVKVEVEDVDVIGRQITFSLA